MELREIPIRFVETALLYYLSLIEAKEIKKTTVLLLLEHGCFYASCFLYSEEIPSTHGYNPLQFKCVIFNFVFSTMTKVLQNWDSCNLCWLDNQIRCLILCLIVEGMPKTKRSVIGWKLISSINIVSISINLTENHIFLLYLTHRCGFSWKFEICDILVEFEYLFPLKFSCDPVTAMDGMDFLCFFIPGTMWNFLRCHTEKLLGFIPMNVTQWKHLMGTVLKLSNLIQLCQWNFFLIRMQLTNFKHPRQQWLRNSSSQLAYFTCHSLYRTFTIEFRFNCSLNQHIDWGRWRSIEINKWNTVIFISKNDL